MAKVGKNVIVAALYMDCPYCGGAVVQDGSLMIVTNEYESPPACEDCGREVAVPKRFRMED